MLNLGSATANKAVFWLFLSIYVAVMFVFIGRVYPYGFAATYVVALVFASAGLITLVARLWEHRWPWPLSGEYKSAWVNDLFVLCVVAGILSVMHQALPTTYHDAAWWPWVAGVLAIAFGTYFQFVNDAAYPSDVAWSPTHAAHSFGSVVVFTYLLLRGAPALIFSDRGFRAFAHGNTFGITLTILVILGLIAFFAMYPVADITIWHTYPWNAHGAYDWALLRLDHPLTPYNPGWMPDYLLHNAARYGIHLR